MQLGFCLACRTRTHLCTSVTKPEVLRPERHLLGLAATLLVQRHHIAALGVVEGGRHPSLAIQVLPACAGDHHFLAKERALGADFLVDLLQCFVDGCSLHGVLRRRELVQPAGLLVVPRDACASFVTYLVGG